MSKIAVFLVRLYQLCIRPLIGQSCRFYPSCSEYTIEALEKYGVLKGSWLGIKRIVRCNPWNSGGHDPLEGKRQKAEGKIEG